MVAFIAGELQEFFFFFFFYIWTNLLIIPEVFETDLQK